MGILLGIGFMEAIYGLIGLKGLTFYKTDETPPLKWVKCREDYMHRETVYDLMVNVIFEKANICLESVN